MQDKISYQKSKRLEQIDSIDIEKELYRIMENPEKYFEPYLKNVKNPAEIIFVQFSILGLLRTIDTSKKFCIKSADHFLSKYSVTKWLDKLSDFYEYNISIINYILENHDNAILDIYNEKQITKTMMEQRLLAFNKAKKQLTKDKEDAMTCLKDLEVEKEKAKEFLD
jgi:hypothetical protein